MDKPVVKATGITVDILLRLAEGATEDQVLAEFPNLTREDLRAAIRYAADTLASTKSIAHRVQPGGKRRAELERLKAARFPAEGKQERVAKALRTLASLRFGIPVDTETAKWAAQDPELEDL
jgi:uncharacterized protein (DUF433 family)